MNRSGGVLHLVFSLVAVASCAMAATVQGVVIDEESKSPLARTRVTLAPLPGNPAPAVSVLANERGVYAFSDVQPGWYLIRAMRTGYATAEYGQARPGRPGMPFEVTGDAPANETAESRQIVMRHQATITGTILDDNSIGIAGWPVSLYNARAPLRRVAQGTTDDRGNFRIGELDPGAYIVRSGGGGLEDASTLVPTYYKYGTAVATAEPVRVRLGETQGFVVIHTVEGQLFELTGDVAVPADFPRNRPIHLTLITDTGLRPIASVAGPFTAVGVPPGPVELLAEGEACAGYQKLAGDRNMFARVDCLPLTPSAVIGAAETALVARRADLAGPGPEHTLTAGDSLAPGHWEFTMRPDASHYLVGIGNDGDNSPPRAAIDGWFGVDIGNAPRLRVTLSDKPASISGAVTSGGKPVIGAPVYLERLNPDAPEMPLQSWSGRADAQGNFVFQSLASGSYRLMSGFDIDEEDLATLNKAIVVILREGDSINQPLELLSQ